MTKKLYEKTGMFVDWSQLKNFPEIDTLIDIGVGPNGTPDLYSRFNKAKLVLIDPLDEAKDFAFINLKNRDYIFHQTALGNVDGESAIINVQKKLGNSSILNVSKINYTDNSIDRRVITINRLDSILDDVNKLGKVGIKIDVEGFELNVIQGATETLKNTKFVLAEVRHNHESFDGVYNLSEFILNMQKNNFILTMIITAKPFIADLCFQPVDDLDFN